MRAKTVDKEVKSLTSGRECIRRKCCSYLDSPYTLTDQENYPCCNRCDFRSEDSNGFFLYDKAITRPKEKRKRLERADLVIDVNAHLLFYVAYIFLGSGAGSRFAEPSTVEKAFGRR